MRSVLIDSGPMIALFAADDRHHERFDRIIEDLAPHGLRLLTTWPCVIEVACLLETPQRYEMTQGHVVSSRNPRGARSSMVRSKRS